MRDPAWLDDLDDEDHHDAGRPGSSGRRRPLLVVLAAVPWLLVVALFVIPGRPAPEDPPPAADGHDITARGEQRGAGSGPDGRTDGDGDDAAGAADAGPEGGTDGVGDDARRGSDAGGTDSAGADTDTRAIDGADTQHRVVDDRDASDATDPDAAPDVAAIAILAARSWLSGADRHDDDDVPGSRADTDYAEHLHLEGLEGEGDLLVARVVALVLDVDAAGAPRLQRIAVPLAATPDGPRLLGTPWELPAPTLDVAALTTQPVLDPSLLEGAERALREAGFTDPRVVRLDRTAGWPLVVTFHADGRSEERQLWLRLATDGRLAVAGQHGREPARMSDELPAGTDDDATDEAGDRP